MISTTNFCHFLLHVANINFGEMVINNLNVKLSEQAELKS